MRSSRDMCLGSESPPAAVGLGPPPRTRLRRVGFPRLPFLRAVLLRGFDLRGFVRLLGLCLLCVLADVLAGMYTMYRFVIYREIC